MRSGTKPILWLAFLALGVAISLALGGCASFEERPVKVGSETRVITLTRTYAATEDCGKTASAAPGWRIVACAAHNESTCKITMQPTAGDDVLGHEARHCFDGNWHR